MPIEEDEVKTVIVARTGITYTWKDDCTLTAEQKADIEASGIRSKKDLSDYLDRCSVLRRDNPTWTDETVRIVAKGG